VNPYRLEEPAVISVSGGRTSGKMLREIMDAYGGRLPDTIRPVFCNTGKEHAKTLDFLHEMEREWGVPITWLEYRSVGKITEDELARRTAVLAKLGADPDDLADTAKATFTIVTYETASRDGEPYEQVIRDRQYLPNPVTRFCTTELKILTTYRYVCSLGWADGYQNAVGLRADEPHRVHRMKGDRKAETVVTPLYHAGVTRQDVEAWWAQQPFDLRLPGNWNGWGNCVGCFLKGPRKIERIAMKAPQELDWWARMEETPIGTAQRCATFREDRAPYRKMIAIGERLAKQGLLFPDPYEDSTDDMPCMCTD
jgi:3'-phosphoadenosine 5'-phosphosulfate sulfotransferase (PAPS reductase)/FAD synthetase